MYIYIYIYICYNIKNIQEHRINRIFHKDQIKSPKQLKLKVAVENNSYFLKTLSGRDHD